MKLLLRLFLKKVDAEKEEVRHIISQSSFPASSVDPLQEFGYGYLWAGKYGVATAFNALIKVDLSSANFTANVDNTYGLICDAKFLH
jgi:hypothetical protein